MKILHILSGFYPTRGGVETLVTSLSKELQPFESEAIFVAPRYLKSRPDKFKYESYTVYSIDVFIARGNQNSVELSEMKSALNSFNRLKEIFLIEKPDLIHIHGVFELFAVSSRLAKILKIPHIHHVHGELPENFERRTKEILAASPFVLSVSNKVASNIKSIIPSLEVTVIPNGISDLGSAVVFDEIRQLAFVGRLDFQKGLDIALKAFQIILKSDSHLHLNIIGVGDHLYFQRLATDLGISANVTFFGICNQTETLKVLRSSQLVVVPSTSIEGFSMVAAEANYLGMPVIASHVGGLSNTIAHGITGLLVPPSDIQELCSAIGYYLDNPAIATAHGRNGRSRMQHDFSMVNYAKKIFEVYQKQQSLQSSSYFKE